MQLLRAFAEILADRIEEQAAEERIKAQLVGEVRSALAHGDPRMVFQPICSLRDKAICGFESLSRFDVEPRHAPDYWFDVADKAGLGVDLELCAIAKALPALQRLPASSSVSVNCSPQLLLSSKFHQLLDGIDDLSRLVLEITEHAAVKDYKALAVGLEPYRRRGAKLAVDDAGAGYSSMRHILNLEPEIIKLDMSLTHSIDTDEKRRALARGLISFAHEIGSLVIAEGVERPEEPGNATEAWGGLCSRVSAFQAA